MGVGVGERIAMDAISQMEPAISRVAEGGKPIPALLPRPLPMVNTYVLSDALSP